MIEKTNLHFDVRQSVGSRNIARLTVAFGFSIGMIVFGLWMIPEEVFNVPKIEALDAWSFGTFLSIILVAYGIFNFLKTVLFAVRAYATTGFWHFRLLDGHLLWQVPNHAWGPEDGFEAMLEELKQLEFRIIEKSEQVDESEYWVHFHEREPVQLRSYSGVNLGWMVQQIHEAGVPYEETNVSD